MFGVHSSELVVIAVAVLIFIGPKELPSALRAMGRWVATIRAHARHFTGGIENMMREVEIAEMEAKWRAASPVAEPISVHSEKSIATSPPAFERQRS